MEKFTGKVYGKSLREKFTGKVYGKSLREKFTGKVYYIDVIIKFPFFNIKSQII
jgi:hypothetical protein